MEWIPRHHPSFSHRSVARLPRQVEDARLLDDVLLLLSGELAGDSRGPGFLWSSGDATHGIVSLPDCRNVIGAALGSAVHAGTRHGRSHFENRKSTRLNSSHVSIS